MKKDTSYSILTERQDRRAALSSTERLLLIQRVLNEVYEATESWEDNAMGFQLAYLAKAIANPDETIYLEKDDATRNLFIDLFPKEDLVWLFIDL